MGRRYASDEAIELDNPMGWEPLTHEICLPLLNTEPFLGKGPRVPEPADGTRN